MEVVGNIASTQTTQQQRSSLVDLSENFDQFLSLLTAQLKYQDPMSPMESTDFTTQLVQFAGVEQTIRTNEHLEALIGMQQSNAAVTALGYIGHTVEAQGSLMNLENGRATFSYVLDEPAGATAVTITDEFGQVVFTGNAETVPGKHYFEWDGVANDGTQLPDGVYNVSVGGVNLDGVPITVATNVLGRVTKVEMDVSGTFLSLGDLLVPLSDVIAIHETPPSGAPPSA